MTPLRIGLAGYGFGGRYFHAPLLASAAECKFLGVITTSARRRTEFAEQFPGRATFDSLEHLAAAGAEAVTISTPPARGSGALRVRFERFAPSPGPSASGGGALLDFGSHLVDQALVLFGRARSVYAEMHTRVDATALDDDVFLALTHVSGLRSHLWGSWRQSAPGPRFRVTGTTASYIVVPDMDGQEDLLVAGHSPATYAGWGIEPEHRSGRVFSGGHAEVLASERGAWDSFYPAFAAAVRGTRPVPVDPWDAVASAEVLDAARQSAETGQVTMIDSVTR